MFQWVVRRLKKACPASADALYGFPIFTEWFGCALLCGALQIFCDSSEQKGWEPEDVLNVWSPENMSLRAFMGKNQLSSRETFTHETNFSIT